MDEYLELMKELGLTEEDNRDEAEDLAVCLFKDGLLNAAELTKIQDRLEVL